MDTDRDGDVKDAVHHRMTSEPRTVMEGAPLPPQSSPPPSSPPHEPLASTSRSQEGIIGTEERAISSEPVPPTMTSSSSMELDLSERERVAELARLDKVFIDFNSNFAIQCVYSKSKNLYYFPLLKPMSSKRIIWNR